jgi:hypothetical protein
MDSLIRGWLVTGRRHIALFTDLGVFARMYLVGKKFIFAFTERALSM